MLLLDTHAAIWFATDDPSLGKRSRALIDTAVRAGHLAVSAISFWEFALLLAKGRLAVSLPADELRSMLLDTGVVEVPVSGDIALLSVSLDLHPDPADRLIVATARLNHATLVTADERLLNWKQALKRHNARK
jgi:PIN domain nuclease of toxin-antitoxin system